MFLRSQPGNNLSASLLAQKLKFLHTPKAFCLCQHLDSLCTYPTSAHPLAAYMQLPVAWRVTHSASALSIGPQPPICTPRPTVPPCWFPDSDFIPTPSSADHLLLSLPPACTATLDQCQLGQTTEFSAILWANPHLFQ